MKAKKLLVLALAAAVAVGAAAVGLTACKKEESNNLDRFETTLPDVSLAFANKDEAASNGGGWYATMIENFDGDALPEPWRTSPHGLRNTEYWCDDTVRLENGNCVISAYKDDNHDCDVCPKSGEFTGGIETRYMDGDESVQTFAQAFGYYEVRVKTPDAPGMWSAFWIQSNFQRKVGNDGADGTEIDIFESAFHSRNRHEAGHALLWDGYGKSSEVEDFRLTVPQDLYDGYHTYALLWTPTHYVFYIDGEATWATDGGGVSKVPEFLRFTNEIRHGYGPHGVKLDEFESTKDNPGEFFVDYVKVYQNTDFEKYIKSDDDFTGKYDTDN